MRKGPVTLLAWQGESWDAAEPRASQHPRRGQRVSWGVLSAGSGWRIGALGSPRRARAHQWDRSPAASSCGRSASNAIPQGHQLVPAAASAAAGLWAAAPSPAGPPSLRRAARKPWPRVSQPELLSSHRAQALFPPARPSAPPQHPTPGCHPKRTHVRARSASPPRCQHSLGTARTCLLPNPASVPNPARQECSALPGPRGSETRPGGWFTFPGDLQLRGGLWEEKQLVARKYTIIIITAIIILTRLWEGFNSGQRVWPLRRSPQRPPASSPGVDMALVGCWHRFSGLAEQCDRPAGEAGGARAGPCLAVKPRRRPARGGRGRKGTCSPVRNGEARPQHHSLSRAAEEPPRGGGKPQRDTTRATSCPAGAG